MNGVPDVTCLKNPQWFKYGNNVEVSLDVILLSESQLIKENDLGEITVDELRKLNNNFKNDNLKYVTFFNQLLFQYPVYGVVTKNNDFKIFIKQEFQSDNSTNLKKLLISLMEFTDDYLTNEINGDVKLLIYLQKSKFEKEQQILLKNLNWLGGKLILNDLEDLNHYQDWFIMEFEI
ncbi:hypothetical protein WICMUC_002540 [Wickerhamomyces mucosus]|uniref:Ornithine decarboxylase antizyme n=1 Tax=Wickerhamomyces mucosus TaxID=1378264 RepID=A0A9P8PNZ3_9ASCO|nr:hypothetical protein WICMUC_002540 [Wickerhamomyces mucosus]